MSRWRAFVDVLDEILNDPEPLAEEPQRPSQATRIASTPIYSYTPRAANRFWAAPAPPSPGLRAQFDALRRLTYRPTPDPQPVAPPDATPGPATQRTRPASPRGRVLPPSQESALQTLIRLGAVLDRSFTARELRTAFRSLAQRYHPDRHPEASDLERKRLGTAFAELTAAYGILNDATN